MHFPVIPQATFLEVNNLGLPSFLQVFSFIIVISEPVSNSNFICILLIVTKTNLLFGGVLFKILLFFFFLLVNFTHCIYFVDILFVSPPIFGFATSTLIS